VDPGDAAERLRELAETLAFTYFTEPPIDPHEIARRRNVEVHLTETSPYWRFSRERPDESESCLRPATVSLPSDLSEDRSRYTLAHEILELEAERASPPLPVHRDCAERGEWLFQAAVSELLMPRAWFEQAGAESDWDLAFLREVFAVSWEAAARRVPICTPSACTIMDNGALTVRAGSPELRVPPRLQPEEREAIEAVYEEWPDAQRKASEGRDFRCAAWAALPERNGIRRVCLLTHLTETD
jgi:hypothetical protein